MSRARILADYVSSGDELADKLSLSGGAMTGAITTNSTFDGIDVGTAVAANTAKVTNSTNASDLASGTVALARGGTGATAKTGTGNNVLATSPTLVTPDLGDPSSMMLDFGTLT